MGRRTYISAENMTLTTAVRNLVALQTAAAGANAAQIIRITRVEISQSGAATSAQVRGDMAVRSSAGTLTSTSLAPVPTVQGGAASGLAGSTNVLGGTARSGVAASVDTGGAYSNDRYFNFNQLNGYMWKPDGYGEELIIPSSTIWTIRFLADPAALTGWTITVDMDES